MHVFPMESFLELRVCGYNIAPAKLGEVIYIWEDLLIMRQGI